MTVLWSSIFVITLAVAASACKDGETAAVDGKCRQFQVCKNGTWTTDSCSTPLRKYSKEQKKCMWWFQVDCSEVTQCSKENQLLKNPYTCSSYYKCTDGKLVAHQCIWPFYFDGEGCKFWGDCKGVDDDYAEECSSDDAEPIANSRRQYKSCQNGFFVQTSCFWGKEFDVETKSCQWFWKVKTDVTTCDGAARAPMTSDGKSYYQCDKDSGVLMKKSCMPLQKFDSNKGRCVFSMIALNVKNVNAVLTSEKTSDAIQNVNVLKSDQREVEGVKNSSVSIKRVLRSVRNLGDSSCTDGSYQTDLNCLMYKVCVGNVWVTKSCPIGQIFSNGMCRNSWDAQCNPGSCITGQKTAYPADCEKYYICDENNNQVLMSCPESIWKKTHFNPSKGECDFVLWWKSCPSSSSYLSTCSDGQNREGKTTHEFQTCTNGVWKTVECSGTDVYKSELNGCACAKEAEHKAALNSTQYLECQSGRWIQLSCLLDGDVFNPMTNICEKPRARRSVSTQQNPQDCVSGDTKADKITGVCSTYMFCAEDGKWRRRACPTGEYYNGQNGCGKDLCPYAPVPGDCESFVMASGMTGKCDFGYRFDAVTRQCVPFAEATCLDVQCEGTETKNHPTSCSRYLQCQNRRWTVKDCGWFHNKFDSTNRKCVFAWWGNGATCRYDPVDCAEGSHAPEVGNCRNYLTCLNKTQHEKSCLWPKKFDLSSSKCVWWGAKCA